jgi:flagellar assembly factor FliW
MQYEVKSPILGFDQISTVKITPIDELFLTLIGGEDSNISFTLVNPYKLREYSFDVPASMRILLDINEKSNVLVYNVVIIQNPLDESCVNFLAPLIFNQDNATMAQVILDAKDHPEYALAEPIKNFK